MKLNITWSSNLFGGQSRGEVKYVIYLFSVVRDLANWNRELSPLYRIADEGMGSKDTADMGKYHI